MEKRKTFHGRQVGKKRLLPIVFPLFLFLLIPLNGYGDDTPMPEVVQQNSTRITGVVKDAYGEPVIGANVKVVGTTQGTITDFEGKFSINVSGASAKIKISFIGYKDKEVTAKKGVSLNIVLEEDAQTLGEVQVVAYGVQSWVTQMKKDCCFISMIQRGVHRLIHSLLNSRVLLVCMLPIIMQGLTCI